MTLITASLNSEHPEPLGAYLVYFQTLQAAGAVALYDDDGDYADGTATLVFECTSGRHADGETTCKACRMQVCPRCGRGLTVDLSADASGIVGWGWCNPGCGHRGPAKVTGEELARAADFLDRLVPAAA